MRYNFRLDKILKLRKYMEKKAQLELAHVINLYNKEKQNLKNLISDKQKSVILCKEILKRGIDARYYRIYLEYMYFLNKMIEKGQIKISDLEKEIISKQDILKEITIKRKVLEKLKDKRKGEYLYNFNRKEQSLIDELFLLKKEK